MANLTRDQLIADTQMGLAAAQSLAPFLGPQGALAVSFANTALTAIIAASATTDITDEQLATIRAGFDAAQADDAAARAAKP